VTRLWIGRSGSNFDRGKIFCSKNLQTSCQTQPAFYSTVLFNKDNAAGAWSWTLAYLYSRDYCPKCPHGVDRNNFTFLHITLIISVMPIWRKSQDACSVHGPWLVLRVTGVKMKYSVNSATTEETEHLISFYNASLTQDLFSLKCLYKQG
jgi:hypothetical protein